MIERRLSLSMAAASSTLLLGTAALSQPPAAPAAGGRTRPLCPYPLVARYEGSGSTDQAENFECAEGF